MPRHSEDTQSKLDRRFLLVAEELVAHGGWEAGTVRKVAEAAGTSRGPIHDRYKGLGLKKALIDEAYRHLLRALLVQGKELSSLEDMLEAVVGYLRADKEAAPLMVQVAALMAAQRAPGGDELWHAIIRARVRSAKIIESQLGHVLAPHQRGREIRAEAIVKLYEVTCMTIVIDVARSNPDLIGLAKGFVELN